MTLLSAPEMNRRPLATALAAALAVVCVLAGCDGGDTRRASVADANLFDDSSIDLTGTTDVPSVIAVSTRLVGTSADGKDADIVIAWTIDDAALAAITDATRLVVTVVAPDGDQNVVSRQRVDRDVSSGELDVMVPVEGDISELRIGLEHLAAGIVDDAPAYATVNVPGVVRAEDTPLERINTLYADLIDNSYSTSVEDGRRVHRFSVRVEATLDPPEGDDLATDDLASDDGRVSVTGLDRAASQHFIALEDGINDPESPVRAVYQEEPVTVFLVMDVSSSISLAGAADDLLDAVSRTVLALAPVSRFDFRVFASDVYEIDSLRDLSFDDLTDSGTALYRAIDTALDDVESMTGDVILIGFTDGRDLASRNFYPAFLSHEQVLDYIVDRLQNVGTARRDLLGKRFEAHFVSLGSEIDVEALERLATAGNGNLYQSYSNDTVRHAFAEFTNGVRGVYQLEYSSQQLAGDMPLVLEVQANGHTANDIDLPTRFGLAPSD